MNIQIPENYKNFQFTDGEASLVAFLLMINSFHGYDCWYTVNSYDIRKILGLNKHSVTFDSSKLANIRKIIDICAWDEFNWGIKFKHIDKTWFRNRFIDYNGHDNPKVVEYKLTDVKAIAHWCYLMGRWRGREQTLLNKRTDQLPFAEGSHTFETYYEYCNFNTNEL